MKQHSADDKFAYVTAITTDSYLPGVLALKLSLRLSGTSYRLIAVVSDKVSQRTTQIMQSYGIKTIRGGSVPIPESIREINCKSKSFWNHTFDKLTIFSLIQFQKLIYIDSDMLILRNIDVLFTRPHMSAVCAGRSYPGNEHWKELNSGLMVVEPRAELYDALLNCIPKVAKVAKQAIGDQDVLHLFYHQWPQSSHLHMGENYNIFIQYIDHYIRYRYTILKAEKIHVIHFINAEKPWMMGVTAQLKHIRGLIKQGRTYEALFFMIYVFIINAARLHVYFERFLSRRIGRLRRQ